MNKTKRKNGSKWFGGQGLSTESIVSLKVGTRDHEGSRQVPATSPRNQFHHAISTVRVKYTQNLVTEIKIWSLRLDFGQFKLV